ncbi:MAG: sugar ABC transporter permease [Chloroflexi bacterium]|nr:sugar ABC transporter permease [Chloroflexota bacterium]
MALLFTLPAIIAFLMFKYYPMLQAIYMSFFDYKVAAPPGEFVALENYAHALRDPLNAQVWGNNIILFAWGLTLGFWVPVVQAMLLNEMRRAKTFFRVAYLLPSIVPAVASAVIWRWIFNPDWGLLNSILVRLGLPTLGWLNDPAMSKFSLALPAILGGGLGIFIYLSALQSVPDHLYEAAEMDGATVLQKIRYITVPGIKPIIAIQFILALSGAFQVFDNVYIMTQGGPADSTRVIALNIYYYAFERVQMGYAAAMSVLLFIVTFILVAVQLRISGGEAQ